MRRIYRNFIRTLLLLLLLSAVFPFVYPLKDGKPLLSLDKLKLPPLPEMAIPGLTSANQPITAYKWQDAQGEWHFANDPPQGVDYETLEVDPNTNLVPEVKPSPASAAQNRSEQQEPTRNSDEVTFGYTPEKIEAMMDKTRQARDRTNEHHQALDALEN